MKRLRQGQRVTFKLERTPTDYVMTWTFGGFTVQANVGGKWLLQVADTIINAVDDTPGREVS